MDKKEAPYDEELCHFPQCIVDAEVWQANQEKYDPCLRPLAVDMDSERSITSSSCCNILLPEDSVQTARSLKLVPSYYEKYTSFLTQSRVRDIFEFITRHYDTSRTCKGDHVTEVDYETIPLKNKVTYIPETHTLMYTLNELSFVQLKGVARGRGGSYGRAQFIITVFQAEEPRGRLVEFQRRSGCAVIFNAMYTEVLEKIALLGILKDADWQTPTKSTHIGLSSIQGLHKSEIEDQGETDKELDMETFQNLIDLAASSFVDIQQEALGALACATGGRDKHSYITCDDSFSDFLLRGIQSQDDIVCENACQLLVNICADERIRYAVSQKLLPSILKKLHSPTSLETMCIKRSLAQVLESFKMEVPDQIPKQ